MDHILGGKLVMSSKQLPTPQLILSDREKILCIAALDNTIDDLRKGFEWMGQEWLVELSRTIAEMEALRGRCKVMSIKFYSRVEKVERKQVRCYQPGTWENAKGESQVNYVMVDSGYYINLRGSHESIYVGDDEPEFRVGDKVSVVIQKEIGP